MQQSDIISTRTRRIHRAQCACTSAGKASRHPQSKVLNLTSITNTKQLVEGTDSLLKLSRIVRSLNLGNLNGVTNNSSELCYHSALFSRDQKERKQSENQEALLTYFLCKEESSSRCTCFTHPDYPCDERPPGNVMSLSAVTWLTVASNC